MNAETTITDNEEFPREPGLLGLAAMTRLAEEIPIELIVSGIKDLLTATQTNGKIAAKLEEGGFAAPPDYRAREAGLKLWLSYVIGMPVQRQHILQEKRVSAPPLAGPLNQSKSRSRSA